MTIIQQEKAVPAAWAFERVALLYRDEHGGRGTAYNVMLRAFARYIEAHEEAPVDPLVLEARRLVETTIHWSPETDRDLASGKNDETREMKIAVAALRRGMELAGETRNV